MNGDDIRMDKKIKEIKTMNDLNKGIINLLFDLYYNERHEWVSDNEILFFINKSIIICFVCSPFFETFSWRK